MEGRDEGTSTGLDPNLAALLSYLLGFVTGILFLVIERRSSYVRFHAYQSTVTFLGLVVLQFVCGFVPLIGWIASALLGVASLVVWVLMMVKAIQGERYKLPIVGDLAEERAAIAS